MFFGMSHAAPDNELYDTLGVDRTASVDEIKRAYRRLAKLNHPDRGGDADRFKKIAGAYEILSDKTKRTAYDNYGKDASSNEHDHMHFPFDDILHTVFHASRDATVHYKLRVSLEELFTGAVRSLSISRQVQKDPEQRPSTCAACSGTGKTNSTHRIAFFAQYIRTTCPECAGTGTRCGDMITETKQITVKIEPGMQDGTVIKFPECADQPPGRRPNDLHVVLSEKPHHKFARQGRHLAVTKRISLGDALCGTTCNLTHLDGRELTLTFPKDGHGVGPSEVMRLVGEGMPTHGGRVSERGDLMIQFHVEMPKSIPEHKKKTLLCILPTSKKTRATRHVRALVRQAAAAGAEEGPPRSPSYAEGCVQS